MAREQQILAYLESVVYYGRSGFAAWVIRHLLYLLSSLYSASVKFYIFLVNSGIRKKHRLSKPVISIGNITVGGTGKTPVVQYTVRELLFLGARPAILSYGYGSALAGRYGVVSDRNNVILDASTGGDEPVMLAESLPGVPVIVCKHRHISGSKAVSDFDADILVLDDGFQVWKLHRDLDIVLLGADNLFDNGRTLPAGKLREPISSLYRAGCIIVTGCKDMDSRDHASSMINGAGISAPVFFSVYTPTTFKSLSDEISCKVDDLRNRKVFAVSSIGNPSSFENTLESTGVQIVGTHRFLDHHAYTIDDALEISSNAVATSADMIVTTMKDAVKLRQFVFDIPVYALDIELVLSDKEGFRKLISDTLKRSSGL
ncbi:MAG: tetraacyldisaccharide 4'-kinase [Armatimonadota bacterium]